MKKILAIILCLAFVLSIVGCEASGGTATPAAEPGEKVIISGYESFSDSEKVIFLVLWIASLFGIAAYLIYIEYTDFEAQEKVRKYVNEEGEITNLIGSEVEVFEENVEDLLDKIEEKKAENIKRIQKKIRFKRAPLKENRNEKKEDET